MILLNVLQTFLGRCSMEKDIISKFNEKFPWNGDTKEIADTAIAQQLLDM